MVNFVMKKNGMKAPLDAGKVKHSIMMAAKEAGHPDDKAAMVADEVANAVLDSFGEQDTVSTQEIKTKVLGQLDVSHPEISAAWRDYDQKHGK